MYLEQLKRAIDYAIENNSFNKLNIVEQADNVCVFGLGTYFKEAFASQGAKKKYNVNLLCDNDPEKWGREFEGLKCVSPADLKEYDNLVVIIMLGNPTPIKKQMDELGILSISYTDLSIDDIMELPKEKEWFRSQKEKIISAYDCFEDDSSRNVYVNALCNRIAPQIAKNTWSELCCNKSDYYNKVYFDFNEREVFVDCGAYIGDSVIDFCKTVENKYDKIFAFELDDNNFQTMSGNLNDPRIVLYNYGVWSENKDLDYGIGSSDNEPLEGISIYKTEKSKNNVIKTAQVKKLDDILDGERVTFIKMDIEGSEVEALKGAENIIRTQKPKLAICVYHKTSDFWQIPLLLKEYNKDYKFGLMHHYPLNCWGTVLYAW